MGFTITNWAAWAPGLTTQDAWRQWLRGPTPLPHDGKPDLLEMPAMQRRRINRLGRMALQVAYWCMGDEASSPRANYPVIFASRHGDVARSETLLRALAQQEPLSPTDFSMSVHNAIGALFSIANGDTNHYSAIAAGPATVESAFVEACGLLASGVEELMVVMYDEPLPTVFSDFVDEVEYPYAWACRLQKGQQQLTWQPTDASFTSEKASSIHPIPHGLQVLAYLTGEKSSLTHVTAQTTWHWHNHESNT